MSKNNLNNLAPAAKPALFDPRKKKAPQLSLSQMLTQRPAAGQGPATQPQLDTDMSNTFGAVSAMATPQQDAQGMPPTRQAAEKNTAVQFGTGMPKFGAGMPTFGNVSGDAGPKSNPSFKFSISHMVPKSIDHATVKQENIHLQTKLEKAEKELKEAKEKSNKLTMDYSWIKQQLEVREAEVDGLKSSNTEFQSANAGYQIEISRLNEKISGLDFEMIDLRVNLSIATDNLELRDDPRSLGWVPANEARSYEHELLAEKDQEISDLKVRVGVVDDELEKTRSTANGEFNMLQGVIADLETKLQSMETKKIDAEKRLQELREECQSFQALKMKADSDLQVALAEKITAENLANQYHSDIAQLQANFSELQSKYVDAENRISQHIGEKQQAQQQMEQHLTQLQHEHQKLQSDVAKVVEERDAAVAKAAKVTEEKDAAVAGAAKVFEERDAAIARAVKVIEEKDTAVADAAKAFEDRDAAIAKAVSERDADITAKQFVGEESQGSKLIIDKLKDDLTQSRQQIQKLTAEKAQLVGTKSHQPTITERDDRALMRQSELYKSCSKILFETVIGDVTNSKSADAVAKVRQLENEFQESEENVKVMEGEIKFDDKLSSQALQEYTEKVLSLESKVLELEGSLSECTRVKDDTASAFSKYQVEAAAELHSLEKKLKHNEEGLRLTLKLYNSRPLNSSLCSPHLDPVPAVKRSLAPKRSFKETMDNLHDPVFEANLMAATRKEYQKKVEEPMENTEQPFHHNEIPGTERSAEAALSEIPEISLSVPEVTGNSVPVQEGTTIDEQIPMQMVVELPISPTLVFAPEFVVENFLAMERPEIPEQTPIPVIISERKSPPRSKVYFWSKILFIVLLIISLVGCHQYFANPSTPGVVRLIDSPRPAIIPIATMNVPLFATRTVSQLTVIPATASASASVPIPQVTIVAVPPSYADYLQEMLYQIRINNLGQYFQVKRSSVWRALETYIAWIVSRVK
ncbi:hypothetical protein EAE96_000956 [Botrytis aclada]|nr:hypothetical protein EAE96_000956 [Botrytis aclada]